MGRGGATGPDGAAAGKEAAVGKGAGVEADMGKHPAPPECPAGRPGDVVPHERQRDVQRGSAGNGRRLPQGQAGGIPHPRGDSGVPPPVCGIPHTHG